MRTTATLEPQRTTSAGRVRRHLRTVAAGSTTRLGVQTLLDQAVVSATNFLTGVIIARTSTKQELGLYMLGFSLFLLLVDLQTSLIATPYMIYAPRMRPAERTIYTGSTLVHQLGLCALTVGALTVAASIVSFGVGPAGLAPVLWAISAVSTAIMFREYARRICFARLGARTALVLDSGIALLQIGGLLLLGHLRLLSASRAYWAIGFACSVAVSVWLWSERSTYEVSWRSSMVSLRRNWTFGKWALGSGFIWTVSMNFYPWLVAALCGTASAGIWAACVGTVALGNPAVLGVQNFLGPKIAHVYALDGPDAMRRFVFRSTVLFALPVSLFCIALSARGGAVMTLLYGHEYVGNGLVVAILAWNLLVTASASSLSRALFAIERADLDFFLNFVAMFVMLALGLWLVGSFGVLGAAFALLTANIAVSVAKAVVLQVLLRSRTREQIA